MNASALNEVSMQVRWMSSQIKIRIQGMPIEEPLRQRHLPMEKCYYKFKHEKMVSKRPASRKLLQVWRTQQGGIYWSYTINLYKLDSWKEHQNLIKSVKS